MLKKEARPFITAKYNWDEIVDKTIQLYENEPVKMSLKEQKARMQAQMASENTNK